MSFDKENGCMGNLRMANLFRGTLPALLLAGLVMSIMLTFSFFRPIDYPHSFNMDDQIPLKVSQSMLERGDLDPDWAKADIYTGFKSIHYNFYPYIIAAHWWMSAKGERSIEVLRQFNRYLQAVTILFLVSALVYSGVSLPLAAGAALFLSIHPALVADALQGRPENLIYLLTGLLLLALSLFDRFTIAAIITSGAVIGVAIAVKFSLVPLVLLPILLILRRKKRRSIQLVALLFVSILLGFAASAPYAILNFDRYLIMVDSLLHQYSTSHPPHSAIEYTFLQQVGWVGGFIAAVYPMLLLMPVLVLLKAPRLGKQSLTIDITIGISLLIFAYLGYFFTKPIFFERNFSHLHVPALFTAAVLISNRNGWNRVAVAACGIIMCYWSYAIIVSSERVIFDNPQLSRVEETLREKGYRIQNVNFSQIHGLEVPICGTLKVINYSDDYYIRYVKKLKNEGYKSIANYFGLFHYLPTSTLQTYFGPSFGYYDKPCPQI